MRRNKKINVKKVGGLLAQAVEAFQAQESGAGLDEEAVKRAMRLTQAELNVLNEISAGRAPRNAQSTLAAIRLKLEFTVTPVAPKGAGAVPITVNVHTLGPETPAPAPAAPLPPEPQDLAEDTEEIH